jgi:hypothetical protein
MFKNVLVVPCVAITAASLLGASSARAADEETKVGGRLYADLTSVDAKSNGVKTNASGYGLDVQRFYLIVDHKFDDTWSANLTTDAQYYSVASANQPNSVEVYIKKAYIQAKISDAFIVRAGAADTPWVPFIEGVYGYRFLEKVLIDRLNFGTSADWGVNINGKPASMVNYSVSLLNGGGYRNPSRSKGMDVEGRVALTPVTGLTIAAGLYNGKRGLETETVDPPNTASRIDLLVAYAAGGLRAGVEYLSAKDWNNVNTVADDKADGFAAWASYDFSPMWGVFARADSVKLSKDLNPGRKDKYFNAGFVAHPRKNVDIAFAYKNDKVEGGTGAETKRGEVGVFGQVSF